MHIIRHPPVGALLVAVLVTGACRHASAEEVLTPQMQSYLKTHSGENLDASWERAFHARATDAMNENESIATTNWMWRAGICSTSKTAGLSLRALEPI